MELYFDLKQGDMTAGLSEAALQAAWKRTLNKFSRHIASKMAKSIAPQADITQKAVKFRFRSFMKRNKGFTQGKLWLGLNPLAAHYVGALRQVKGRGVKVRGHSLPKSFIAKGNNNGKALALERVGGARYPIKVSTIEWSDRAEQAFQDAMLGSQPELLKRYLQEINYERIKGKTKS